MAGLLLTVGETARDEAFTNVRVVRGDQVMIEEGNGYFFDRPTAFFG